MARTWRLSYTTSHHCWGGEKEEKEFLLVESSWQREQWGNADSKPEEEVV